MADELGYSALEELSDNVLMCKALWQHAMEKNPTPQHIDGPIARLAHRIVCLRCTRCGRERYIYLDSKGHKIGNYYKEPVGYPKTHRMDSDELWLEAISRSLLVTTYKPEPEPKRSRTGRR